MLVRFLNLLVQLLRYYVLKAWKAYVNVKSHCLFVPSLSLLFFFLQPVRDTLEEQVQLWKELILDYCKTQKIFVIGLEEEFSLFSNSAIEIIFPKLLWLISWLCHYYMDYFCYSARLFKQSMGDLNKLLFLDINLHMRTTHNT